MPTMSHDPETLLSDIAWMRRLALRLVGDVAVADDLVQDTWVAALERGAPQGPPTRAWLGQVIRNLSVSRFRREARRASREVRVARPERTPGHDDLVARVEAQRRLADAVLELDEPSRTVLLMRFHEELQPQEIARRLDLPAGTVRSRISRALQVLRARLGAGDRDLRAALGPVLAVPLGGMGQGAAGATLSGSVHMKKILIASSLAASITAVALWAYDPEAGDGAARGPTVAGAAAGGAQVRVEGGVGGGRTAASGEVRTPARRLVFGSAAGWWLEGAVYAPRGFGEAAARVTVRDRDGRNPQKLAGVVHPDGRAELRLDELFRHPELLTHGLRVEIDHPAYLPARVVVAVDRRQRQDGYLGRRARVAFDVELQPASAPVAGRVRLPAGRATGDVRVALFPRELAIGASDPVDVGRLDGAGAFRLRGARGGRYRVVAWLPGADALEPGAAVAEGGDEGVELRLAPGAVLRGRIAVTRPPVGVRYVLRAFALSGQEMSLDDLGASTEEVTKFVELEAAAEPRFVFAPEHTREFEGVGEAGRSVSVELDMFGPAASPAAPFVDLDHLFWTGERFEYAQVDAVVAADGAFAFTGLHAGKTYQVESRPRVESGGRQLPVQTVERADGGAGEVVFHHVTAPEESLALSHEGEQRFVQCTVDGERRAVLAPTVTVPDPDGGAATARGFRTDDRGAVVLDLRGGCARDAEIGFAAPGFGSCRTRLLAGRFNRVALRRRADVGSVTLHLQGDPERNAEVLCLQLARVDDAGARRVETQNAVVWKRQDSRIELRDLAPGRYELRMSPYADPDRPDYSVFVRPVTLPVTVEPGGSHFVALELLPAGYLEIVDPALLARELGYGKEQRALAYRLLDAQGRRVSGRLAVVRSSGGYGEIAELRRDDVELMRLNLTCRFFPLLAPGGYVLETWARGEPQRVKRVPVEVRAGEATRIGVPE